MSFTMLKDNFHDSTPNIEVRFPDGYEDRLVLQKHYFNEEDKMKIDNHCNYVGHLAREKTACVAMTGCLGSDNVEFTIMSKHAADSNSFVWKKNGAIHAIHSEPNVSTLKYVISEHLHLFFSQKNSGLFLKNILPCVLIGYPALGGCRL